MTTKKSKAIIEQAFCNSDLDGTLTALRRASKRAWQIAAQTGTAIVVVRNGTLQHIYPRQTKNPVDHLPTLRRISVC